MKRKSQSAQDSLGQRKRPSPPPIKEVRDQRSYLTAEDVRQVVREELERAMSHWANYFQRDDAKSMGTSNVRNLQLQLQTKLSLPIYTGRKLEGKGGDRISVALIDANTGELVKSGPESYVKLNVVVLEGDFNKDNDDDWAEEEFEKYVLKERDGKRPLLIGNLRVTLKEGVGELGDMTFTDNSSWTRSKSFRIGLKVASCCCGNTRIREAKTDAFAVREHRGQSYKKNYPPKSDDEVWRLEQIAKGGKSHYRLSEAGIERVEDFLLQLFTDSDKLREILGKSIIPKSWDSLVRHAKTCKISRKLYLYYLDSIRKLGALFDADGQLIGLIKDRLYIATHQLSVQEKEHGETIVKKALDNKNDVMEFNGETFSPSTQKKSSSSLTSQICAAPDGLEAPLGKCGIDCWRDDAKSMGKSNVRNLQLQLQTKLSLPIYTGRKLEGKGGDHISVALIDANTGELVKSGPESYVKLNVVVLEGDFNKDNDDDWAEEEFEKYVLKERD